mgnify:FL=1
MITSKQRAELRAAANALEVSVQIGNGGLTENVIKQVQMNLASKELVKIDCLKNSDVEPKAVAEAFATALKADVISVIGRKVVIYKYSSNAKHHLLMSEESKKKAEQKNERQNRKNRK